jgi:hypothetical protein
VGGADEPSTRRDWEAVPSVVRARECLGRGYFRAALTQAWKAASLAVNTNDERGFAVVRALASEIEEGASGRARRQAAMLGSYVDHCGKASAAGLEQGSLLARLFARSAEPRTKRCPDCAEQVKAQASACRFCGYRFDAEG